ncbi:MAG: ABC-2 family transporter protein [Ktedonobacteraceae bacterium]|nr:ABC-2 family transporter protein [Ktedonobacteraceae bacterium]
MLSFYFEVARTAFRRQLIYRWTNIAGMLTNIFFGMIFSYVIIALFQTRPAVSGHTVQDTLRYTWLVQAMIMVVLPFGWMDLMMTIRTGEVVSDLSKPCDFYRYWFSREVGRSCYFLLYRALPTYLAGMLLFGFGVPAEWHAWLAFAVALLPATMLGIAYRFLYNIVAFWLLEARAAATLAHTIALFFTGSFVPIPLLPGWMRALIEWLPFNGLLNLPTEMLLGKVAGGALWFEIGRQLGWLIILTGIVRLLTVLATRHVVAQGG